MTVGVTSYCRTSTRQVRTSQEKQNVFPSQPHTAVIKIMHTHTHVWAHTESVSKYINIHLHENYQI
jgi:hypothetical protein